MTARRGNTEPASLSTRVRRSWEVVTTGLALLTAIYLILNTIEPTRLVLERYVLKLNLQTLAAIVAIMLEVAIIAIYQLGRQVREMRTEHARSTDSQIVNDVVGGVLNEVDRISKEGRRADRSLEVLGLTLNTAWPLLAARLTAHQAITHWNITLYCLSPEFIADSTELPDYWSTEATRTAERIRSLLAEEGESLRERHVHVELRHYSTVPVVHGFRFGNGDILISYLQWAKSGGIRPFEFYERITMQDTSTRANHYRDLFDSWISRAAAKSTGRAIGNGSA